MEKNCITILVLYCDLEAARAGRGVVLQDNQVYCNKGLLEKYIASRNCIAIQLLYCNLGEQ